MNKYSVNRQSVRRIIPALMIAGIIASAVPAIAADIKGYILKANGDRIGGSLQWQPSSKVYLVRQDGVSLRIPFNEVSGVRVPKPKKLDAAIKQVQSGNYAAGIPDLERIKKDYERLQWDVPAASYLAYAYLKNNNAGKALRMCEDVIRGNPAAELDPDFSSVYWDAMLQENRLPLLKDKLQKVIREGSRELAAAAQIQRGHLEKKSGNLKEALVDGYLRTIVLFKRVRSAQPEALYNAVVCFKELGQHTYAEKMRKTLLENFPQSSYASKIRSEM